MVRSDVKSGEKRIRAVFFCTAAGTEPVRDWLKGLSKKDRTLIGKDVMKVEYGWPLGMPVCRPLGNGLYEIRTDLSSRRIARVLFFIYRNQMVLLHGFIKKDQKTPKKDLTLARNRKRQVDNAS